jgi:type II secretory pathway pseudopilin PulG
MLTAFRRHNGPRRGVTLVEMLVVVALVVLMMVILVQIFQQATGVMIAGQQTQNLDLSLRSLDQRLKQDLIGATAKFTPPNDPSLNRGYFEYGEGAFADLQGEDSDDYLAFTTKAPEGQVFTGRVFIPGTSVVNSLSNSGNQAVQPVTVTSQLAEVIYFLRNGNLYRRVFLIAPERQNSIYGGSVNLGSGKTSFGFQALSPAASVSWLGVNDLSGRPAPTGQNGVVLLNDLGSLTNRENRAFRPRFRTDYFNTAGAANVDGIDDDLNGDDVSDFYPTLYPGVFTNTSLINAINPNTMASVANASYDALAFPYVFPGMYSQPETSGYSAAAGWIHSLDPSHQSYLPDPFTNATLTGNHNPLVTGDNLPIPLASVATQTQTWWGFPTWRETLSPNWHDPVIGPAVNGASGISQVNGLRPIPPNTLPASSYANNLLPPMNAASRLSPQSPQYANDGVGSANFATYVSAAGVWDDDLICTGVRSFDVKVLDNSAPLYASGNFRPSPGYYDLGYALQGSTGYATATPTGLWDSNNQPQGFGHAGRMPPLSNDNRLNPSRPSALGGYLNNNVGDNGTNVTRLTRVWDSWSTDYTNAPDVDVFYNGYAPALPIYPSYPAPYTSPLRGIQIQIRVNDPRGEYVKTLTIRHDFTDKL